MKALLVVMHRDTIPWFRSQFPKARPGAWNHKEQEFRMFYFYEDCGMELQELKDKLTEKAESHDKYVEAFMTKRKIMVCSECRKEQKVQGLSFAESCSCGNSEFDVKEAEA